MPLLSIVIANYNYGRFLESAIKSVVEQEGFDKCELIVVDGGSTDNSVEVIKKYANGLPPNTPLAQDRLALNANISWWCSEKDNGQSAAFNKGFRHAQGRFLTWLNADDVLMQGTVTALDRAVRRYPNCEWFTGNLLQFRDDTSEIISAPWGPHILPAFIQTFTSPLVIFGPTTFWSASAYMKIGPIDEELHYSMDTDYWLRMMKAGYRQRRLNHCCWAFRMHAESKTAQYDGHEIDKKIENKWYEELRIVTSRWNYRCSMMKRYIAYAFRALDGSAFIALWRRFFVVGRQLCINH